MDSIKILEEQYLLSEISWGKVFGSQVYQDGEFLYSPGKGWRIGNNVIRTLNKDGSLADHPEKLDFLKNGRFYCDSLYINKGKIEFVGIWQDGVFMGDYMFSSPKYESIFEGGLFKGGVLENVKWETSPVNFISGKISSDDNELLGVEEAEIGKSLSALNILAIPVNHYAIFVDKKGKKQAFKLIKTIDKKDSSLVFMSIPDEKRHTITWENMRNFYDELTFRIGEPAVFGQIINIPEVAQIIVSQEFSYQPKRVVEIDLSNIKQLRLRTKLNFNVGNSQEYEKKVLRLKNLIDDGTFGFNLSILKSRIEHSVEDGEASDLGDFINKAKSGSLTGLNREIMRALDDSWELYYLITDLIGKNIATKIFTSIQSYLRPKVAITPKPKEEKPDVAASSVDWKDKFKKNFFGKA